jgi:hypothetical protein
MKPGVEVYNLVDAISYSVRDLASMMARGFGGEMEWKFRGRWTVDGGRRAEGGGRRAVGRGRWAEDGGRSSVFGLRSTVFRLPHSLPVPLAKGIAWFGDAFWRVTGKNFPLTSSRLEALLETRRRAVDGGRRTEEIGTVFCPLSSVLGSDRFSSSAEHGGGDWGDGEVVSP